MKPKKRTTRRIFESAKEEETKSWWNEHPPVEEEMDPRGAILGSDKRSHLFLGSDARSHPDSYLVEPRKGMRVEEVIVSRSGGGGGTVVCVTSLPLKVRQASQRRAGVRGGDSTNEDDAGAVARTGESSWAVCVEWDIGLSHVYHARTDKTFNLRLIGETRRMQNVGDNSIREGMVVELSQEGRDWYLNNSPTSVGLSGRGRVLRAFESNSEVMWSSSSSSMRVPNRFLVQRNAKRLGKPSKVDAPTLTQSKQTSGSGGDVAIVQIDCATDGAVIRYAMDKPSAPGLTASGTSSHSLPGHGKACNSKISLA